MAAVVTGMVPYHEINMEAPIAAALPSKQRPRQPSAARSQRACRRGRLAGMTSVLLVLFLSQARIFMAMSRDGLLPQIFGRSTPRSARPTSPPWSPAW